MSQTTTPPAAGAQGVTANAAKMLDYIAVTSVMSQKAAEAEKKARDTLNAVQALAPQACDAMVNGLRCHPHEREKLAAILSDHEATVKLLIKVAAHRNKDEMAVLGHGSGDQTKQANDGGNGDDGSPYQGYAGERTSRIKASDHAWFRGLGVNIGGAGN